MSWLLRMMQDLKRNWYEGFEEFWPEYSKVSKICFSKELLSNKVYIVFWAK